MAKKADGKKEDGVIVNRTSIPYIPTTFMYLDYMNGKVQEIEDKNGNVKERSHQIGMPTQGILTMTGKSATGKTTLGVQLAGLILNLTLYKALSDIYFLDDITSLPRFDIIDSEFKFDMSYGKRALKYDNATMQSVVVHTCCNKDVEVMAVIQAHVDYKVANMKKVRYAAKDIYGDHIHAYPPTVILIDSINQIVASSMESFDDRVENISGMRNAKSVQNLFSEMSSIAEKYNILFIVVSHILNDAKISMMPQPKAFRGLKQGEKFVAGEKGTLLTSMAIRVEQFKDIGSERDSQVNFGDGVEGFITRLTVIKSSSNVMGRQCYMVNIADVGYSPILSTFYNACEQGHLEKAGNFYKIPGSDVRLSRRNVLDEIEKDFGLANQLYCALVPQLETMLSGSVSKKQMKNLASGKAGGESDGVLNIFNAIFNE
jgi:hypothetical protein